MKKNHLFLAAGALLAMAFTLSCSDEKEDAVSVVSTYCEINPDECGSLTDPRDGKTYKTVEIGEQVWMAENLNYVTTSGRICHKGLVADCEKYGLLYNWGSAMRACPDGWHLPSKEELKALVDYVESDKGCEECAGKYLKAASGWKKDAFNRDQNGTDDYGFTALPGGFRFAGEDATSVGRFSAFWSDTERKVDLNDYDGAYRIYMSDISYNSAVISTIEKSTFLSVRCVQDEAANSFLH